MHGTTVEQRVRGSSITAGAFPAFSAAFALTDVTIGTNENWVSTETTVTFVNLGLVAGAPSQIVFSRVTGGLTGDSALLCIKGSWV